MRRRLLFAHGSHASGDPPFVFQFRGLGPPRVPLSPGRRGFLGPLELRPQRPVCRVLDQTLLVRRFGVGQSAQRVERRACQVVLHHLCPLRQQTNTLVSSDRPSAKTVQDRFLARSRTVAFSALCPKFQGLTSSIQ